jgi:subtilisin family serine protease
MSHQRKRGLARSLVSALAAVAVITTGLAASGLAQAAPPTKPEATPTPASKIKPELLSKLEGKDAKEATDFWVRFSDKADLAKASKITNWNERGTAVAAALRKTAADSQAKVKAELDAQHVQYQTLWATNAIVVKGGSLAMAQSIAGHTEVEGLYNPVKYEVPVTTKGTQQNEVNAVEWGIANVKADQVWSTYGDKGAGITVASIDTGVQYDHPALVNQYRGKQADGTFDHNYNWFDAAGTCSGAPCDTNGHGTHTMGTMAGDDGAGNQIGVAPGVKWIAANGCCPTDEALITSGQWMLEPTNLAGTNPDASKRPNVINNSWGSTLPSNDPFMEDVTNAWTASGIFGVFANGNSGSACNTSGSPGSEESIYSVGAYDVSNNIASFSGRGTGQNGVIKPNISAPGVNVRSSLPGNTYGAFNGTSMATPHLAGVVALLWSGAPSLKGDVAATRALLNGTAIDSPNAQCGGTDANNNVFGQGRVDALALLNAAPVGDTGTLAGKVTATGGAAVAGAAVTVTQTGSADKVLTTSADGSFTAILPAGDYSLAVAAFGYKGQTGTATIAVNTTTTKNFTLEAAATVSVGGTISDGSGHGWPLYAKVSVEGPGGVYDYTTPTNGRYSFKVPSSATYTLKVESQISGYQTVSQPITVGAGNLTKNVAVPVDSDSCLTAPGYRNGSDGVYETFDGAVAPSGWTVVDNKNNGQVWKFTDVGNRGNLTGAAGGFAIVDSDKFGSGGAQDTSLVSPVVDLTAVTAPKIKFNQDLNYLSGEKADVDLSIDGGTTWANVLTQATDGRGVKEIAIPQAAGKSAVQVRFHYYDASYEWWWEVDNILIGSAVTCEPTGGGLVVGNVKDANTNGFVNGAVITRDDKASETATTVATPEDTGLADGFYWLYSADDGPHGYTAKAGNYTSSQQSVDVEADWVAPADYSLKAGRISVGPTALDASLKLPGGKVTKSFTVTNTGGADVDLKFGERDGGFTLENANGSKTTKSQVFNSTGAPLERLQVPTSFANKQTGKMAGKPAVRAPLAAPWTDIANYPSVVMDNRVVNLDGKIYSIAGGDGSASTGNSYVYDPAALAWTAIAPLPGARNAVTVGAVGGKLIVSSGWGTDGGPDAATWSYDPAANAWSAVADNPAPRAAAGQAVLDGKLYAVGGCTTSACTPMSNSVVAYDAATNSWATLANYPKSVAFAACGAIDGKIYCSGGNDGAVAQKASYVYDPGANSWSPIADSPADHWAASFAVAGGKLLVVGGVQGTAVTNAGFAFDPAAGTWAALPNANQPRYRGAAACGFYKVGGSSGGFTPTVNSEVLPGLESCSESSADVSWLSIDQTEATLAPGEKVTVKVALNAAVDQPGTYTAAVTIGENTPYSVDPVDVKLSVTPPTTWSKLAGTVTGVATSGTTAPLAGTTVEVDSWAQEYTFITDKDGGYAYWLDRRNNPLTLIAAKDGYKPQTRSTKLINGETVVEDFALKATK